VNAIANLFCISLLSVVAESSETSRFLPLDHWAYEGIRILRLAGYLEDLNPLVQPYRRDDAANAVEALSPDRMPAALAHWARLLRAEFLEGDTPAWGVWAGAGARAATSDRADPLRPAGGDENLWPFARVAGWIAAGPVAAEVVVLGDRYLDRDPDGIDPQRRIGRTETAYLSVSTPHLDVVAGRLARNWFRLGSRGFLVSDAATPYPQIGLTFRTGRFTLHSFAGELETLGPDEVIEEAHKRYLGAHRVDLSWPNLVVSFGESILFAGTQGGFSLRHLNPVEVFYFESDAPPEDLVQNLMLNGSVWWRRGRLELFVEGQLDDVDVNPPEGADREPTSYAFALLGRGNLPGGHGVEIEYRQVAAWAYRTPNHVDRYSYLGRGLGENFSDFDRLGLRGDVLLPGGLRLSPTVVVLRQGEGSFRAPVPPNPEYNASPNLFLGVRERTVRFALAGRYQPRRQVWAAWDAGVNVTRNRWHVEGEEATEFEALVEGGVRFDLQGSSGN